MFPHGSRKRPQFHDESSSPSITCGSFASCLQMGVLHACDLGANSSQEQIKTANIYLISYCVAYCIVVAPWALDSAMIVPLGQEQQELALEFRHGMAFDEPFGQL